MLTMFVPSGWCSMNVKQNRNTTQHEYNIGWGRTGPGEAGGAVYTIDISLLNIAKVSMRERRFRVNTEAPYCRPAPRVSTHHVFGITP